MRGSTALSATAEPAVLPLLLYPFGVVLPTIIHQDSRLLVIDKPAGLLSVPGIGSEKHDSVATRIVEQFSDARIVHRLDRDTSGVMVLARDEDSHSELSRQFHDREVEKRYIAVVAGHVDRDEGVIDQPIAKDRDNPPLQKIDPDAGRRAVTHFRVLDRGNFDEVKISRLELRPITGRSHQLRLHLQWLGHPIVGDTLYAPPEIVAAADRLLLHATSLWLVHPGDARPCTFTSPSPF